MAKTHVWGASSTKALGTCTPETQRLARRILDLVPFDLRVLVGHRGRAEQEAARASGNSNAGYGQSPHNCYPSWAIDVAPILDSDADGDTELAFKEASGREVAANGGGPVSEAFRLIGLAVAQAAAELGTPATWGGDWDGDGDRAEHRLYDPGHIEIVGWKSVAVRS